jgi:hypothetical protein
MSVSKFDRICKIKDEDKKNFHNYHYKLRFGYEGDGMGGILTNIEWIGSSLFGERQRVRLTDELEKPYIGGDIIYSPLTYSNMRKINLKEHHDRQFGEYSQPRHNFHKIYLHCIQLYNARDIMKRIYFEPVAIRFPEDKCIYQFNHRVIIYSVGKQVLSNGEAAVIHHEEKEQWAIAYQKRSEDNHIRFTLWKEEKEREEKEKEWNLDNLLKCMGKKNKNKKS